MRKLLLLILFISLMSCGHKLLVYKNVNAAQYVVINKTTMAFSTYDRKPEVNTNLYYLCRITKIKETKKYVYMDCITIDMYRSTIRVILKEK